MPVSQTGPSAFENNDWVYIGNCIQHSTCVSTGQRRPEAVAYALEAQGDARRAMDRGYGQEGQGLGHESIRVSRAMRTMHGSSLCWDAAMAPVPMPVESGDRLRISSVHIGIE